MMKAIENSIIKVFENEEFGKVRTISIGGEPWFVGRDVCAVFGDKNRSRTLSRVDEEDKQIISITDSMGRPQNITIINESGLYSVLFTMQPQKAHHNGVSDEYPIEIQERIDKLHHFKRWVTSKVLPSIRKTGSYSIENINERFDESNAMLLQKIESLEYIVANIQNQLTATSPVPNYEAIDKWKENNSRKRVKKLVEETGFPKKTVYGLIYGYMGRMFGFVDEVALSDYTRKYNLFDGKDEPIINAIADNIIYQSWFIQATDKMLRDWKIRQKEKAEAKAADDNLSTVDVQLITHRPFVVSDDCKMVFDSVKYIIGSHLADNGFRRFVYREMYDNGEWASLVRKYNCKGSSKKINLITNTQECKKRFVDVCNKIVNEFKNEEVHS